MSQSILYKEIFPEIYSVYPRVLDELYQENPNNSKIYCLQQRRDLARKLHQKYLHPKKQHIEVEYADHQIQEVYTLRYSFPHALQIPWVLDSLREKNFHNLENKLTVSLFGGGPCPEILGLWCYLKRNLSYKPSISAALFDIVTNWKWKFKPDTFFTFKSNVAGDRNNFLNSDSRKWVENSDLVVIQNCLNEIPVLSYQQLHINMKHIVDIIKPGALMLVIEKRYSNVEKLLQYLYSKLIESNNIQTHYNATDEIDIRYLNYNQVPSELIEHLFLRELKNWLWLTNRIKFHWLAISKQRDSCDA